MKSASLLFTVILFVGFDRLLADVQSISSNVQVSQWVDTIVFGTLSSSHTEDEQKISSNGQVLQWQLNAFKVDDAISQGSTSMIESLIRQGTNMSLRFDNGQTPIHMAVEKGSYNIVKLLLNIGNVNVNILDDNGLTPLHVAAIYGHVNVISLLIEKGAIIEAKNRDGNTPLAWAAYYGKADAAAVLIEHGANINSQNNHTLSPLHMAVEKDHVEAARLLIEKGAIIEAKNRDGWTPLAWAAFNGNVNAAELLIEHGANVNLPDKNGQTPLHKAVERDHVNVARLLIDKGATIEAKNRDGWTPLAWAAFNGKVDAATFLIENGANVNLPDNYGHRPLHKAVERDQLDVARLLIEKGAIIEAKNRDGWTPLAWAAFHGKVNAVRFLIEHGANVNLPDNYGHRPLHKAVERDQVNVAKLLIEKGAIIDAKTRDGWTPLAWAAYHGKLDAVTFLIDNGANVNSQDINGLRPLHQAIQRGKSDVADLLSRFGGEAQAKSAHTTNSPTVGRTTKSPVYIQTTQPDVDTSRTKTPVVAPFAHEVIRNSCKSYVRFAESLPITDERIIGGSPAQSGEFPWMAALGYLDTALLKVEFSCGGTLISDNFVLTAAHCVKQSLRLVLVRLGKLNLTDRTDAVDQSIEGIIKHPDYSLARKLNDIALIRIKPVAFSRNVIPACLRINKEDMPSNEPLIVTGWGSISAERTIKSSILLKTQLQTMKIVECSNLLSRNITNGQYCAFDPHAQNDSCQGDSGGPLQAFTKHSRISAVVGIVSYGISCGTAMPAVYTRVAHYVDWIASHVWPNTIG